jgi:hypothetical protein
MVDIMSGAVTPVHKDQSRNSPHRQALKKKNQDENRKNKSDRRRKSRKGDWVTISHGAGDSQITY